MKKGSRWKEWEWEPALSVGMTAQIRSCFSLKESTVINKLKHSPSVTPVLDVWRGAVEMGVMEIRWKKCV